MSVKYLSVSFSFPLLCGCGGELLREDATQPGHPKKNQAEELLLEIAKETFKSIESNQKSTISRA